VAEELAHRALAPVGPAEREHFARLIAERLGPPGGLGRAWARAHARAALASGRGLTDGRAVACLDPPGIRTPVAWGAWLVALGLPAVLLVGAGATLPDTGLVLGLVGLVTLAVLVLAALAPSARWRCAARRRGDAWLYAVAKPADDPPRSAGLFLAALAAHLDSAGWPCSLVTGVPALVARYREIGFELEGQVKTATLLQRAHPCAPGAPMGAGFARE
jgi:hypothetical protein